MKDIEHPKSSVHSLERPPIVVVMGHVDHGKTTLLDYLRKSDFLTRATHGESEPRSVAEREAGGITQSIGAYEVVHKGKPVTFIDTPGHEAFSKMRARGATLADMAILVVAADDGVKPQTKEVIEILTATKTPFIVAINKIDKNNADIERTKNDLLQAGVLLEGFGGSTSWHGISAKTGEGIDDLLDLILLAAEVEGLTYDPAASATGVIIEAKLDRRRGIIASAVVRNGVLKEGMHIGTPTASGKIKVLENWKGERATELAPSSPALVIGFDALPEVGEEFKTGATPYIMAAPVAGASAPQAREASDEEVNVVIKADVAGSLEVISEIIKSMPGIRIISQSLGDVTDGDIKSAAASQALIVGFRVSSNKAAEYLARAQNVSVLSSEIIYELMKALEDEVQRRKSPGPDGDLEVLAVFSQKGRKQVVGGKVVAGKIKNNVEFKVIRGTEELGSGRITNLQQNKKDTHVVNAGDECGLMVDSGATIAVGDHLIVPPVKS